MTDDSKPSTRPSDVSRLLLKAVNGLAEDEREVVLAYFFELGLGVRESPFLGPLIHASAEIRAREDTGAEQERPKVVFSAQRAVGPDQVMIPVRLSTTQHGRLKEWCAEHGFPMAAVVRGLIERFLEDRAKDAR